VGGREKKYLSREVEGGDHQTGYDLDEETVADRKEFWGEGGRQEGMVRREGGRGGKERGRERSRKGRREGLEGGREGGEQEGKEGGVRRRAYLDFAG
jgi:hypothetical protein